MQEQVSQLLLEKKPESLRGKLVVTYGKYKMWILIPAYLILIGALVLPETFKPYIAGTMGVLFSPLVSTLPFLVVVLLLTAVVAAIGMLLQKYMVDEELSRIVGARNKALKVEFNEARRAGDQERLKELRERQMASIDDSSKVLKQMIKPLGYLMLFSFPVFIWMFWYFADHPELYVIYPFLGKIGVMEIFIIFPGWIIWSIVCSFSGTQLFRILFNVGREPT